MLLNWLLHTIGLSDANLNWFHLYLTNRTEYVSIEGARSGTHTFTCGVPQGSVLGPTLFTLYMLPLGQFIGHFGVSFHCYADDTQLYTKMDTHPSTSLPPSSPLSTITTCLEEIKALMKHNFLQLNSSKTEVIFVGTPHQIQSSSMSSITFSGQVIPLSHQTPLQKLLPSPQKYCQTHILVPSKSTSMCKTALLGS